LRVLWPPAAERASRDGSALACEELALVRLVVLALAHLESHIGTERRAGRQIHERLFRLADGLADRVAGDGIAQRAQGARGLARLLGDPELHASQREAHGGMQPLRRQQPLRQIVGGAELQGAHRGELVAVLGQHDHRGARSLIAQLAQQLETGAVRIFGARAEVGGEQQQVAIGPCEGFARVGERLQAHCRNLGLR